MGAQRSRSGFTLVELIVVIVVIAILAVGTVVAYNGWRVSMVAAQIKNDIISASTAMESAATFGDAYPSELPGTVVTSPGVVLMLFIDEAGKSYCIEGTSSENESLAFYVASTSKGDGAKEGTCADRPDQSAPTVPTNVAVTDTGSSSITLSWTASENFPLSYTAQCAKDAGFVVGVKSTTQSDTMSTVAGLDISTTSFCRVRAVNGAGMSAWSVTVSSTTSEHSCEDTGEYGTYPACYAYDALPVATSIEGYWTAAPDGFLLEDGSAVSRTTYANLFAVIGTTYGAGDGSTTFNLPDSRGRTAVNHNTGDAEFATVGQKTGSNTEQITIAKMPSHSHLVAWIDNGSDVADYLGGSAASYGLSTNYAVKGGSYNLVEYVGDGQTHNNIQPSIVKVAAIKYRPSTGSNSTLPVGTSIQGYWTSAPAGYLLEDGGAISRSTYSDLFTVMGTTHGAGNGSTTFNLPDSRGRASVNISASDSEFDVMGEKTGSKTEQLTVNQIPAHTHRLGWMQNGSDISDYLGGSYAAYGLAMNYNTRSGTYDMLQYVGGSEAHNNVQKSIVKKFAVKYTSAVGSVDAVARGTSVQGYWSSAPSGYLLEDGSAVSRTTYSDLFAIIGTTYGAGNGSTTFNLPDSRGRISVNRDSSDANFDQMNDKPGAKTHTLTIPELPSHTHAAGWLEGDISDYLGGSTLAFGISGAYTSAGGSYNTLQTVGSGQAHNNIMPTIVKRFAIKY